MVDQNLVTHPNDVGSSHLLIRDVVNPRNSFFCVEEELGSVADCHSLDKVAVQRLLNKLAVFACAGLSKPSYDPGPEGTVLVVIDPPRAVLLLLTSVAIPRNQCLMTSFQSSSPSRPRYRSMNSSDRPAWTNSQSPTIKALLSGAGKKAGPVPNLP